MYKGVSFFANAGIGDVGVEKAGVNIIFANELLEKRAKNYQLNHKKTKMIIGDINKITIDDYKNMKEEIGEELFLLVATPPCQGVSLAGKRDKFDIRNQLIKPTVKAIKNLKPKWIWIENVPNYDKAVITDTEEITIGGEEEYNLIEIYDFLKKELTPFGYKMEKQVVDAKDFGVPQTRKRLLIIMTRTKKEIVFPEKEYGENLKPYKTTRDAIGHLESLESNCTSKKDEYHYTKKHNENHVKWMKATPEGKTAFDNERFEDRPHTIDKDTGKTRMIKAFRTTYKRIYWDQPSPTVTMGSGGISSQNNVHPKDSRALTVREVMLIQSMPMNYKFVKGTSDKEMREMVGEAVPCLMAEKITKHIINLENRKQK